ncbi:MAG: type III-B CRISPR module RAMP protein Cmr6, partial [Thermoguttaceae bacterium]|nr:type III-B CRISPR module RAMP protein Cmr6 [Thermoguttaceae bacterium]
MPIGIVEVRKVGGGKQKVEKPFLAGTNYEITPTSLLSSGWFRLNYSDLLDGLDIEYEIEGQQLKNVRTYALLPKQLRQILTEETGDHPGLMFDKFIFRCADQSVAKYALVKVVEHNNEQIPQRGWSKDLFLRWQQILSLQRATCFSAVSRSPLTLHLARASALENAGICMHPIYGFVYMPGSGLKGMARAFAETVWLPAHLGQDNQDWRSATDQQWNEALELLERVFGYVLYIEPSKEERAQMSEFAKELARHRKERDKKRSEDAKAHVGEIVFYDAWPIDWSPLVVDILNNHHKNYYEHQEPPGDWESPVPVYFLAVPAGQEFLFALRKRRDDVPDHLLELAVQWLIGALQHQGAGAKTAAGYGSFEITHQPQILHPPAGQPAAAQIDVQKAKQAISATWQKAKEKKIRCEWTCTLELVTPAFLAGAKQNASDCELRPATLRGLLRWWWRTMHAGHVDARTLAQLESAVWGSTSQGGAVQITVRPVSQITPILYDKQAVKHKNALPSPPDDKTTPGLWYFSFGMDDIRREIGRKYRFQRYFVEPGARWQVRFTARASRYQIMDAKGNLLEEIQLADPQMLLQQAQATLWLLCQYGGIGAKSRKGFGCFTIKNPEPDEGLWHSLSVDQCPVFAKQFREACGVKGRTPCGSPRLEDMLREEILTP